MKTLKKLDIIIIFLLFFLSFTPHFILSKSLTKNFNSIYANIKVNGQVYQNLNLSDFHDEKIFNINDNNTILIKNNTIRMLHSNCNDLLCIKQGVISNVYDTIICLPNKIVIEIKGKETDSSSDMILSH